MATHRRREAHLGWQGHAVALGRYGDLRNYGAGWQELAEEDPCADVTTIEHEATLFDSLAVGHAPASDPFRGSGESFDQACFVTDPAELWARFRADVVQRLLRRAIGDDATSFRGSVSAAFDIRSVTPVRQLRWQASRWVFGVLRPHRLRVWCGD